MTYLVLARKWRPQTFDDLTGQKAVVQTLENALATGRVAHAYLFSGVRGVGKTTSARLLAKALNCEKGTGPDPCGVCTTCREIADGSSIDVIEIDGASNTGVDDVRELRDNVKYAPSRSRYKVFIIDEVHMLSTAAFNALLKTLEEPPPHIVFIFATTEAHKIPATILSRCQHFVFRRIPLRDVVARLRFIIDRERIEVDDTDLLLLARASGGSLRDSLSLLDQAISFCGNKVTTDALQTLLGLSGREMVRSAVNALAARDGAAALQVVRELSDALRNKLGEKLSTIQSANLKLEKVATPSLQALQHYSQGMALGYSFRWEEALTYFQQAVKDDPNFASAYLLLGYTYSNLGKDKQAEPFFKKAYELAGAAPDRERQFIRCTQLDRSGAERAKVIEAYEKLVRLYPDHFWATNNLSNLYGDAGKPALAADMMARRAELRPNNFLINYMAFRTLKTWGNDRPRAEIYRERARRLEIPDARTQYPETVVDLELDSAFSYWLKGDLPSVHRELERVENLASSRRRPVSDEYHFSLAGVRLGLGEFGLARKEILELDPNEQALFRCLIAYAGGNDRNTWRSECGEMASRGADAYVGGTVATILLARAGLISEAERFRRAFDRASRTELNPDEFRGYNSVLGGEIALASGDAPAAEKLLAEGTEGIKATGTNTYFLGMESLSRILEAKGDLRGAIRIAESASQEKQQMQNGIQDAWSWGRVERLRAELYRKAGRTAEAGQVEDELSRIFANADPDLPLAAGLLPTEESQQENSH